MALNSEEGQGTEFHFEVEFGADTSSTVLAAPPVSLRGLNVLVVDDNATNRSILEEILSNWQLQVTSAENARTALQVLVETEAQGRPIQLVLLDMMMPETDGLMLAEQIQNDVRLCGTPLIILSSSSGQEHSDLCTSLGIVAQLRKPVKQTELPI